jgi:hypothetical protein
MYTDKNYQTKKALKDDVAQGKEVTFYQPNADITGATPQKDGQAHKWYAKALAVNGLITKVF